MHHAGKAYGNGMELNIHTFLTSDTTRLHKKQKYLANIIHTHIAIAVIIQTQEHITLSAAKS
jgi:hypothetical protein